MTRVMRKAACIARQPPIGLFVLALLTLPCAALSQTTTRGNVTSPVPSAMPSSVPALLGAGYAPLAFSGLSLQQAEDRGVALSPDVEIARASASAASALLAAARTGIGPSLIASYVTNPQAGATPSSTVTQTALNVGVQATLLSFTQYLPLLYQAEAAARASEAHVAAATRTERVHAATLYFDALKARAAVNARHEALNLAAAQLQAAQRRFKSGDAPRIDVVRAQVAAAQATAALETAQATDQNASEALALETGTSMVALGDPAAGSLPDVAPQTLDPGEAVRRAMLVRSEVLAAEATARAASAGVSAAHAGVFPSLTLSAGYEHGIDTGQPVKGPTVNASFELPLNGASSARVSAAEAASTQAQAELHAAQRATTLEVGAASRNLGAALHATVAATAAREAALQELNATVVGYRTGGTSSLERTSAAATYADARLGELSAIYDEAQARETMRLELGP